MRGPLDKRAGLELHIYTWRSLNNNVFAVPKMPRRMRELRSTTKRPKKAGKRRGENLTLWDSCVTVVAFLPFVNTTLLHWDAL